MIHAVIIDDEMNGVRSIELLLNKFVTDVKVVATSTSAREGIKIINDYRPEIVFLDITMPDLNGFELLEQLEFKNFHLIFSTAHQEYGLKALKIQASAYLLKPIDVEELKHAVGQIKLKIAERAGYPDILQTLKHLNEFRNLRVPLPGKDNIEYVAGDQLVFIEADSNRTHITLKCGNVLQVNSSLKDYESLLCKPALPFMRIHASYIINLDHVTRYVKEDGGYAVMQGKKSIPISKFKKDEFLESINIDNGKK